MKRELLEIIVCPGCQCSLSLTTEPANNGEIIDGELECKECRAIYPIRRAIPRFVRSPGYASSFGFQWNRFRMEQLDFASGTTMSRDRFYSETGWTPVGLAGKRVLDAGCGAGRFLDIVTKTGAHVVGVDLSDAVDAVALTLADRSNLDLIQASIDALPFRPGSFDAVYSIGVIQHTSNPESCVRSLARALSGGGSIAITAYERRRWTLLHSKYWVRRLTTGLSDIALYRLIGLLMPLLFPMTEVLFRIPVIGRFFRFAIPVANYVDGPLTLRQRYRWALLDTFDMLAPAYDHPQRFEDLRRWLEAEHIDHVTRLPGHGLHVIGQKRSDHERS